jgi:hypothetical protein
MILLTWSFSNQVFEHVMDYPTTLREIHRVLTPGGAFLHIFPSRYKFIEPHMLVPLGGVLRSRGGSSPGAGRHSQRIPAEVVGRAGVRGKSQVPHHAHQLSTQARAAAGNFSRFYTDVRFVEDAFRQNSTRGRKIHEMGRWLPFLPTPLQRGALPRGIWQTGCVACRGCQSGQMTFCRESVRT